MQSFITHYGYFAVFLLMLAESACIPVPSEVIMMFGGAAAAGAVAGAHPSLAGIVLAGVLGNVAGSYVAWAVGKYVGQSAVHRWGRRVGIRQHEIDRATGWFERHGPVAVLFGRVIPVIRTFISLPAGFAGMPAGQFGLYTTLGCIPWTAALAIAGYALGANWQSVANDFHGPTYAIAGIIAVALAAAVVLHFRRRRGAGTRSADGHAPGPQAPYGPGPQAPYGPGPQAPYGPGGRPLDPQRPAGPQRPADRQRPAQPPAGHGPGAESDAYQWAAPGDRQRR